MGRIIGVYGKARSGKTTIADYLHSKYHWYVKSFADKVKGISEDLFRVPYFVDKTEFLPELGMTKRELLQKIGTAMREIHPNVWVKYNLNRIKNCSDFGIVYDIIGHIIPDVRYPNEMKTIQEMGGKVIKIVRTGYESDLTENEQRHMSETALDGIPDLDFDLVITAESGGIAKIYNEIDEFVKRYK